MELGIALAGSYVDFTFFRCMHMLDSGAGMTTGLPRAPALPCRMQRICHPLDYNVPGSEGEDDAVLFSDTIWTESDEADRLLVEISDEGVAVAMAAGGADGGELRSVREAQALAEWPQWEAAIQDELGHMEKMKTWELTEKPPDANLVGSKWVFKIKRDASGAISKYKACLVVQGFLQIPGINFTETFTPVTKLSSLHIIATLAAGFNWELHQMDVKNAY
ncbi:hypothetical protein EWM64_g9503 [Hericium alpestre]|uniref:Reverse transcriptase Ty1/copia-type domain-containing protein n=1 Tax=Hericium alpestre TaxID=135208 RepID=A0A4Y9ZM53_9AGAM|nr:hypothetical protein EWM64_g9503 [Hericium alpestre]